MVSPSPIADINRTTILALGFTTPASRSPTTGAAITRTGAALRVPGSSGAPVSSISRRTRSGRARAYHRAQVPPHRTTGERRRLQPQLVQDVIKELDGSISVAFAGNLDGVAQPVPRPVHRDPPYPLQTFQQRKERERGRAGAV